MMGILPVPGNAEQELRAIFADLAHRVRSYDPELVVVFTPDHMNGFAYELMPPFCIGFGAKAIGDYKSPSGELDVPEAEAKALHAALTAAGFDVAISYRMEVDHGCSQPLQLLTGGLKTYPVIPIFINAAAPPRPTWRRVRLLGEAVGHHFKRLGKRVLLIGSGGLSHDPPIPAIETAPEDVRERLISGLSPTPETRRLRDERTRAASVAFGQGKSDLLPLSETWDRAAIDLFIDFALPAADDFDDEEVTKIGGRGAHEVRTWVAAAAAQSVAGRYKAKLHYQRLIPEWIVGMGVIELEEEAPKR